MVPPLALLSAESAGAVAGFRGRTLEEAQRQAGLFGCEAATLCSQLNGTRALCHMFVWS